MMPSLQTFLAALTIFPSVSLAVAPAQVPPNGKGHGFIGNFYPQPSGDWLTSTLCYCHSPVNAKEIYQYEKAHIFQHEYYNYHSNATFFVDHICLSERGQCVRPNIDGDNNDWFLDKPYQLCKKFPRTQEEKTMQQISKRSTRRVKRSWPNWMTPHNCVLNCDPGPFDTSPDPVSHRDHDKVCFAVGDHFYGMSGMELWFNTQRRKMDKPGAQGRIKTDFNEVRGYCEDMCQSAFGMPAEMKIKDKRAEGGSRQYLYTSLDDMCDHCK